MEHKTLKVLQIFGSLNMGGAESRMIDIYRNLDRDICDFDFLTMLKDDNQYYEAEIEKLGGNIIKIDSPRKSGIFKHIISLYKIIKRGKYNAVHAHTSYHCGIVAMAAFFAGAKIRISHSRTTGSKQKSKFKRLFLSLGRSLVNIFSTHKFAISKDAGKFLFGKSKFQVIPNAIDVDKYIDVSNEEILSLKEEFKLSKDNFVVGQIGRFDPMKNHEFTIKWFAEFLKVKPNAILMLVGDGPLRQEIYKQCRTLEIEDKVIFTGVRGDVPKLIHVFDVMIFPSIFEGLGGVVLEAQAAGVPSVVSDNIPRETDLGLDMVNSCSLSASFDEWNDSVFNSLSKTKLKNQNIIEAFNQKGYSIASVSKKFIDTYKS